VASDRIDRWRSSRDTSTARDRVRRSGLRAWVLPVFHPKKRSAWWQGLWSRWAGAHLAGRAHRCAAVQGRRGTTARTLELGAMYTWFSSARPCPSGPVVRAERSRSRATRHTIFVHEAARAIRQLWRRSRPVVPRHLIQGHPGHIAIGVTERRVTTVRTFKVDTAYSRFSSTWRVHQAGPCVHDVRSRSRPERHFTDSFATMRLAIARVIARWLPRCPACHAPRRAGACRPLT